MSKLYTANEIAEFVGGNVGIECTNADNVIQALDGWVEHMESGGYSIGREIPDEKLSIIGRERWLLDDLTKGLQAIIGGPPPSKKTMDRVRRHESSRIYETRRGDAFEVRIISPDDRKPTGHIARVTVELDRFEPGK